MVMLIMVVEFRLVDEELVLFGGRRMLVVGGMVVVWEGMRVF